MKLFFYHLLIHLVEQQHYNHFYLSNFILSVNGKKPSDAQTNDLFLKYLFLFFIAKFNASTLFVCP